MQTAVYTKAHSHKNADRDRGRESYFDFSLLFLVIALCAIGIIMVFSSSAYFVLSNKEDDPNFMIRKQGIIVVIGIAVMIIFSLIDYHLLRKRLFGGISIAGLLLLLATVLQFVATFFGHAENGSSRWLKFGPASFQPSEFAKFAVIMYISTRISYRPLGLKRFRSFLIESIYVVPIIGLIIIENLSSGIIVALIYGTICFVNSPKILYFLFTALAAFGIMVIKLATGSDYRSNRVAIWRDVENHPMGQQILQGLYAITSGGLFGTGLGQSAQKYGRVPEAYNDMIFTIICEELGLVGGIAIIMLYLLLVQRLAVVAANASDVLGSMITVGVMSHIGYQVVLNILVVTNTIPSTGVSLPFISYGGSSTVLLMAEVGVVLNISKQIKYKIQSDNIKIYSNGKNKKKV